MFISKLPKSFTSRPDTIYFIATFQPPSDTVQISNVTLPVILLTVYLNEKYRIHK